MGQICYQKKDLEKLEQRVHEVINEMSAPAPIIYHLNLFETSPIGADKFISANRIGGEKFFEKPQGVYSTIAFYIILENPRSSILSRSPIGAQKFCSANRSGFKRIRMEKNRH